MGYPQKVLQMLKKSLTLKTFLNYKSEHAVLLHKNLSGNFL
jgi:hypothetical protein